MKRWILTLMGIMVIASGAFAQACSYNPNAIDPEGNGEIWPPQIKPAYQCNGLYSQVVSVVVPSDTTILPLITCTVNSITLDDVVGMPSGFTYACNPSSCVFPGGANVCVLFAGDASTAAVGDYPIAIVLTSDLSCPVIGPIVTTDTVDSETLGYSIDVKECGDCATLDAPQCPQSLNLPTTGAVELSWGRVVGSAGYQICGGPIPANGCLSPVIGETNTSRQINYAQFVPGATYRWSVRAGCGPTGPPLTPLSVNDTFASPTLRMANIENLQELRAEIATFPNPATDNIFLQYTALEEGSAEVRIFDVSGRIVMAATPEVFAGTNLIRYEISEFEAGVYVMEVNQNGSAVTTKFTVQ